MWSRLIIACMLMITACTSSEKSPFEQATGIESEHLEKVQPSHPLIIQLMNKSKENPQVRYSYSLLPNLNTQRITVKGANIKMELISGGHVIPPYSAIYLNRKTQEAFGICEERGEIECDPLGKVTSMDFTEVNPITTHDWLAEIPATAQVIGTESFNREETTVITFQQKGKQVKMWIHDYYHLPVKVELSHEENEDAIIDAVYLYNILQSGKIKTAEVTPSK